VDDATPAAESESRERDVVRRLRAGDRSGLGELVDLHGESLMQYLVSILHDRDAAEDAFQDTWVRVVQRIGRFDPDLPFAPWLFRVARNRAYDHLRWSRRWSLFGLEASERGPEAGSRPVEPAAAERLAAGEVAGRLLEGLDPGQREIIWLRFFRECSYQEIARICGLRLGTVKSRLRRALQRLAVLHARMEETGDVRSRG
jgi:RNA polymerase sigma-70 factor (ECF subfamily)